MQELMGPCHTHIYIYIISSPEDAPRLLKTHKINIFELLLDVPSPLETYWLPLWQNSHFGKRCEARDMIFFGYHDGPHIPNIGYFGGT